MFLASNLTEKDSIVCVFFEVLENFQNNNSSDLRTHFKTSVKIVNGFQPSTIFTNSSILDIRRGYESAAWTVVSLDGTSFSNFIVTRFNFHCFSRQKTFRKRNICFLAYSICLNDLFWNFGCCESMLDTSKMWINFGKNSLLDINNFWSWIELGL